MTEDDIRKAVSDPKCSLTYQELWDMCFGPRGRSISEIIAEMEQQDQQSAGGFAEPPAADENRS